MARFKITVVDREVPGNPVVLETDAAVVVTEHGESAATFATPMRVSTLAGLLASQFVRLSEVAPELAPIFHRILLEAARNPPAAATMYTMTPEGMRRVDESPEEGA